MTIQTATTEHLHVVYQLTNELEETILPFDSFEAIYWEILKSPIDTLLVLIEDGQVLGYLHLQIRGQLHHGEKVAEILELIVNTEHRKQGLGQRLLEHGLRYAQKKGAKSIELTSNMRRIRAHQFYERNGYTKTSYKLVKSLQEEVSLS